MSRESLLDSALRIIDLNPTVSRRQLFIGLGAGIGVAALAAFVPSWLRHLLGDGQLQLPDYLLKPVNIPSLKEAEVNWGRTYQAIRGDTISSIAAGSYTRFNDDQFFYIDKLRFANTQDRTRNTLIHIGQALYIPDPRVPILGFAAGDEAVLMGDMVNGKYMPTKIEEIDNQRKIMRVHYYNGSWEESLIEGGEFMTSRVLKIVAVLDGISGLVPPRVVFKLD